MWDETSEFAEGPVALEAEHRNYGLIPCDWCGAPHDDLVEVDTSEPGNGYYRKAMMCADCIGKRRIERNRR